MNEKVRVFGKGFVLAVIGAVVTGALEFYKTSGVPTTKEQWISILLLGVGAGAAYIGVTLSGPKKEVPTADTATME